MGNHDQGRMGYLVATADPAADDAELLARVELADDLLFLARGTPVVYYGDEQGFTGCGGDQLARQDMFPSLTPEYVDDDSIGTDATPADDNFDPEHPLYRHIASLAALRADHPVFVTGAHDRPRRPMGRCSRSRASTATSASSTSCSRTRTRRWRCPPGSSVLSPDTAFTALRGDVSGRPPHRRSGRAVRRGAAAHHARARAPTRRCPPPPTPPTISLDAPRRRARDPDRPLSRRGRAGRPPIRRGHVRGRRRRRRRPR